MSPVNDAPDTRPEETTGRTVVGLFAHRAVSGGVLASTLTGAGIGAATGGLLGV